MHKDNGLGIISLFNLGINSRSCKKYIMFIFKFLTKEMYEIFYKKKFINFFYNNVSHSFFKNWRKIHFLLFKFMNILVNAIHFIKNVWMFFSWLFYIFSCHDGFLLLNLVEIKSRWEMTSRYNDLEVVIVRR